MARAKTETPEETPEFTVTINDPERRLVAELLASREVSSLFQTPQSKMIAATLQAKVSVVDGTE